MQPAWHGQLRLAPRPLPVLLAHKAAHSLLLFWRLCYVLFLLGL